MAHPALSIEPEFPVGVERGSILFLPTTESWMYPAAQIDGPLKLILDVLDSKIAMEEHVKKQRVDEAQRKAAAMVFDEQMALRYQTRLLDLAVLYRAEGEIDLSRLARAAAAEIARDGGRSEFGLMLFQKSVAIHTYWERQRRARKEAN